MFKREFLTVIYFRIIVQHMEGFQDESVIHHIPPKYSIEMAKKSEVVSGFIKNCFTLHIIIQSIFV